jgi:hypothetical protein
VDHFASSLLRADTHFSSRYLTRSSKLSFLTTRPSLSRQLSRRSPSLRKSRSRREIPLSKYSQDCGLRPPTPAPWIDKKRWQVTKQDVQEGVKWSNIFIASMHFCFWNQVYLVESRASHIRCTPVSCYYAMPTAIPPYACMLSTFAARNASPWPQDRAPRQRSRGRGGLADTCM